MDGTAPVACSLSGEDYRRRHALIREVGSLALLATDVRGDGVTLTFSDVGDVREQLTAIADAERSCCSFLDISLTADGARILVTVSGLADALPIVRDLTSSFTGEGE